MDGTGMKFARYERKSFTRILFVLTISQALIVSIVPLFAPNAQTNGLFGEESAYHTYDEMTSEIMDLQFNHSSIMQVYNLTITYEGRTLWAVKISDEPEINDSTEPDVLVVGGQKANSFISVEITMFLLNYLVNNHRVDQRVTELVDTREIWIIPMLNPDGHEYINNLTLDWEKNRRDNGDDYFGVHLERNYGFNWSVDAHTSDNSSSRNYMGPSPFSEAETKAVKSLVENHSFVFSLAFSSYGQVITYPWGYTSAPTSEDELFKEIASDMAMYSGYEVRQAGHHFQTHGNMDDWMYNSSGVLPFTIFAGTENFPDEGKIESISYNLVQSCLYLLDIADNPNRALLAEWSFLIYMGGDNDLEDEGIRDINEMEKVGSNPYFNIVVQFDRAAAGDNTNGGWTDTRRFLIMKDDDEAIINSPMIQNMNELNTGDPQSLLDFVNWSITNYPAKRYLLDLWGHGRGWLGVSVDNDSGNDWLGMDEIKSVLPKFKDKMDVVGFDNCNMAMIEVYTTFLNSTDYIIGSEKEEDAWGWPYDTIFTNMMNDPQISPLNLSKLIAYHYVEWAQNSSYYSATTSVVDMAYLTEVINRSDALARELNRTMAIYSNEIEQAALSAEQYARPPNPRDLYHFAEMVQMTVPNRPIQILAEELKEGIETLILANHKWTSPTDTVPVYNANGISVWLYDGGGGDFAIYQTLDFADLSYWDEFLASLKNPPPEPQIGFVVDHTLSDSDGDDNMDTITLLSSTNTADLDIQIQVFNNDNQLITFFNVNDTIANQQYSESFKISDFDLPSDNYHFSVYLVDDSDSIKNYGEVTYVWLGNEKPDLVLENVTLYRRDGVVVAGNTGKKPIDGETTTIAASILNNGTSAHSNVMVEFFEGSNVLASQQIDLARGERVSLSILWQAKAGESVFRVEVDGDNEIKEVNESNNEIMEVVEIKPNIPSYPLVVRGKIFNKDKINIIDARVQIKNLRTNETINTTTSEKGYKVEMESNWFYEGDKIDVKGMYSSASDNVTFFAYSDDDEVYVNMTLNTEVYDWLFYFKIILLFAEGFGFLMVLKLYISIKRTKKGYDEEEDEKEGGKGEGDSESEEEEGADEEDEEKVEDEDR